MKIRQRPSADHHVEEQLSLYATTPLGQSGESTQAGGTDLVPELTDEMAAVWGLPVGRRARMTLRGHTLDELSGRVKIARLPGLPLDPREELQLCIGLETFTSRQVSGWCLLE